MAVPNAGTKEPTRVREAGQGEVTLLLALCGVMTHWPEKTEHGASGMLPTSIEWSRIEEELIK